MSIPTEKNTSVKVTERLSKYKDLEIEVQRMCVCVCVCGGGGGGGGVKATTIPVVIGILGLIKLRNLPSRTSTLTEFSGKLTFYTLC